MAPSKLIRVYIAHAMRGDGTPEGMAENRRVAALWVAWAFNLGYAPVCSWVTITGNIEDSEHNRHRGLACDKREIETCDMVFLCGDKISRGMLVELEHASFCHVATYDLTVFGFREPPSLDFKPNEHWNWPRSNEIEGNSGR